MDPDEKTISDSIIIELRQRLDAVTFDLARANAQGKMKDQLNDELRALIPGPEAEAPKPGPPPAR